MCNIGEAIGRAFTPPGTGGLEAQAEQAQQTAINAANQAVTDAKAASLPVLDNPSALSASQTQLKALLDAQGAGWSFGKTPTVAPAVATKQLLGA